MLNSLHNASNLLDSQEEFLLDSQEELPLDSQEELPLDTQGEFYLDNLIYSLSNNQEEASSLTVDDLIPSDNAFFFGY